MAKKKSYEDIYWGYLSDKLKLKTYQKVGVVLLILVFSGFAGWLWEFFLQEIDGGFRHLYVKGGNLLPWISLYAYGALIVVLLTRKIKRYPWAVFVVSVVATGLVEWFAGWIVYECCGGVRYWNYADRWWGVGNIDGFVCPASVTVFGLASLVLVYCLVPICIYMAQRMSKRVFLTLAIVLFAMVTVDEVVNLSLRAFGLPSAMDLYQKMGWVLK